MRFGYNLCVLNENGELMETKTVERHHEILSTEKLDCLVADAMGELESASNPLWRDALLRIAAGADHLRILKKRSEETINQAVGNEDMTSLSQPVDQDELRYQSA